jgi:hypothetical protein
LVNARRNSFAAVAVLLLAAAVLTAAAWNRSAEYDEQYTFFVTSGTPRPAWPDQTVLAGDVVQAQAGHAGVAAIARDLRRTDVHPPLYFWAVALWRPIVGDGLFAVRLLSVLCGLGAIAAVGSIARRCEISPALAMLLTLGCYGFAYTGAIARGFALAQMLTLVGLAAGLRGRHLLAGMLLGGAVLTNYLAVFVGAALVGGLFGSRRDWRLPAGFLAGVLAAGWFFVAQRGSRDGQFPPFELLPALLRLARYGAANLTGGLPLYAPETARTPVAAGLALGLAAIAWLVVRGGKRIATPQARLLLTAAAIAPPLGLIGLGLVFDNTPIELRYLSFATPFVALLVAATRPHRLVLAAVLGVQAASLAGLILRPETMQPARATAMAAAALVADGAVLIPRGNDGVGIVGAFATEAPAGLPMLLIGPNDSPDRIRARIAPFRRIVLVALVQDDASRSVLPAMQAPFGQPDWRETARGFNIIAYQRVSESE